MKIKYREAIVSEDHVLTHFHCNHFKWPGIKIPFFLLFALLLRHIIRLAKCDMGVAT